eukprot:6191583-Pleurochrysis_carterae.AAC.3
MIRALGKCGKLISDINNREGVEQVNKALGALEQPRRQTDPRLKEEQELALKQVISGIISEWRDTNQKRKRGVITLLGSWTGVMMNWTRMQMKTWVIKKNKHKASVQRRWDNRGKMHMAFQRCRKGLWQDYDTHAAGIEEEEGRIEKERTYGIKHWGRVRTIPRIHIQVKNFLQLGIG